MLESLKKQIQQQQQCLQGLMKINFESKPVYGDDKKYIKTNIKKYSGSVITNFHNKKVPKNNVPCKCLSIIMIDSVIKAYLEECKYIQEKLKTKTENYIDDDDDLESDNDSNVDNDDDE